MLLIYFNLWRSTLYNILPSITSCKSSAFCHIFVTFLLGRLEIFAPELIKNFGVFRNSGCMQNKYPSLLNY